MHRSGEELKRIVVGESATLRDAVQAMDRGCMGIVVVVDGRKRVRGVVTNGDFRRAILAGKDLSQPVASCMNRNPTTIRQSSLHLDEIQRLIRDTGIQQVPVLDEHGALVDLVLWQDLQVEQETPVRAPRGKLDCEVVVMAGGKGTRLEPFTRILPKPLLPIGGKPILEIILDRFAEYEINTFHITLNNDNQMTQLYLDSLGKPYSINYLRESQPLGTAGSLGLLRGKMNGPFFVTNCDVLVTVDFTNIFNFHLEEKNVLSIVGSMKHHTIPYGVCEIGNGGMLKNSREKPQYDLLVNTGLYVLSQEVLDDIPANSYLDMTSLIETVLKDGGRVGVFPISEGSWMDTGQWEEYERTTQRLESIAQLLKP